MSKYLLSSRVKIIRKIKEARNHRTKAKALTSYYENGGSVENVVNLLESKPLRILSLRDYADTVHMIVERHVDSDFRVFSDVKKQNVLVMIRGNIVTESLQSISSRLGKKLKVNVNESKGFTAFSVPYKCEIEGRSKASKKMVESAKKACKKSSISISVKYAKRISESAKDIKSPRQLHLEYGLPYDTAKNIYENVNGKKVLPSSSCPMCSQKLERAGKKHVCSSCSFEGTLSESQKARGRKVCGMCSSVMTESTCGKCGWSKKREIAETTVQQQTAPSMASSQQKMLLPGACPSCNGSMMNVGDTYRCLTCGENHDLSPRMESKVTNHTFSLTPKVEQSTNFRVYRSKTGVNYIIEAKKLTEVSFKGMLKKAMNALGFDDLTRAKNDFYKDWKKFGDNIEQWSDDALNMLAALSGVDVSKTSYTPKSELASMVRAKKSPVGKFIKWAIHKGFGHSEMDDNEDYMEDDNYYVDEDMPGDETMEGMDHDEMEETDYSDPLEEELPQEKYAVIMNRGDHAREAVEVLRDQGAYSPGMIMYTDSEEGWQRVESDVPNGRFMIPMESMEQAQTVADFLSSNGYDSEVVESPELEEKMSYYPDAHGMGGYQQQGSTFDYKAGQQGDGDTHAPWTYDFYNPNATKQQESAEKKEKNTDPMLSLAESLDTRSSNCTKVQDTKSAEKLRGEGIGSAKRAYNRVVNEKGMVESTQKVDATPVDKGSDFVNEAKSLLMQHITESIDTDQ